MTATPEKHGALFAAKGQALPSCSEPLADRSTPSPLSPEAAGQETHPTAGKARNGSSDEEQLDGQVDAPASVLSIDLRNALVPAPQRAQGPADGPATVASAVAAPAVAARAPAAATPATATSAGAIPGGAIPGGAIPDASTPNPPWPSEPRAGFGQSAAGPLAAAIVAIVTAAGVFFFLNGDRLGDYSETRPPAPAATAADPEATAVGNAAVAREAAPEPSQDAQGLAAKSADDPPADEQASSDGAEQDARLPSFDLVRMEPDGSAVIAGRAAPYAELILLHNGEPIGTVTADWAGEWAFVTDRPLQADEHAISLLVNEPDAEITLPQGTEAPARVSEREGAAPPAD